MQIEEVPFLSTSLGRRVLQVVRGGVTAITAARDAYKLHSQARYHSPDQIKDQAQGLVNNLVAAGLRSRSAPVSPREKPLGWWKEFPATHLVDPGIQAAMRSQEARKAKTTSGAGLEPTAWAPYPEITLPWINSAHRRAYVTGWADRKADIDQRYLMMDSHLQATHGIRKAATRKYRFAVRPRSATPLGLLTANAVRASWGHCDGFLSSMGELGVQANTGFSSGELVWKDTRLSIPIGKKRIAVDSEVICSIEQVYPRNFGFDVVNDRAYLCMGPNAYIDVNEPGLQKFIFIKADGAGPTRYRGYGWANAWLSYLGGLSLERFGVVVETFGVATPYLERSQEGYLSDDEHAHALDILANVGTGKPEVIPSRYGTLEHSPVPAGLAPLHAQMLSVVKGEQSKLVLSSTLQMETDGIGSNALGLIHQDQQTDIQRIDCGLYAEAITSQPFRYLVEANADRWALAFSHYIPGGCTPWDVIAECPTCEWVITEEAPAQRLAVFQGAKALGIEPDPEQMREELRVRERTPDLPEITESAGWALDAGVTGEGEVEQRADDEMGQSDAARLAAEMTEHGIERCQHGATNRCRICGIERVRGVVPGEAGQPHSWKLEWKAIQSPTIGLQSDRAFVERDVTDDEGHKHGSDGKFTSGGGGSSKKPRAARKTAEQHSEHAEKEGTPQAHRAAAQAHIRKAKRLLEKLKADPSNKDLLAEAEAARNKAAEHRSTAKATGNKPEPQTVPEKGRMLKSSNIKEWASKHYGKWANSLPPAEREAVNTYIKPDFRQMNGGLREHGGDVSKINTDLEYSEGTTAQAIKDFDNALAKAPPLPETIETTRIMKSDALAKKLGMKSGFDVTQFKPGSVIQDHGYMSTDAVGKFRANQFNDIEMRITIPKGSRVGVLSDSVGIANRGTEEVTLPRGSRLQVNKVTKKGNSHIVEVSLIND